MWNPHGAQHHVVTLSERVHIQPLSYPRYSKISLPHGLSLQNKFGQCQVFRAGDLDIAG